MEDRKILLDQAIMKNLNRCDERFQQQLWDRATTQINWDYEMSVPTNKRKRTFRFDDLFDSIDNAINNADINKDTPQTLFNKVEEDLKPTKAYPVLKTVKRLVKNKISKSKEIGKWIKKLNNHFKNLDKNEKSDMPANQIEVLKFLGAVFMTTAKTFNKFQHHQTFVKPRIDRMYKTPNEIWSECQDEINGNYYRWSEWPEFFIWQEWEEDSDHKHILYKIKWNNQNSNNIANQNTPKPWITNFPIPETFGTNCCKGPLKSKINWWDIDFLKSVLPKRKFNRKEHEMNQYKARWNRPAIIEAPEGALVGSPGSYVIAEFMIENKSDHNLPKKLFMRKTSDDEIQFVEFEDTDRLSPGGKKKVELPLLLPPTKGTFIWAFSYFNINNKKVGGDFIVKVICE